MQGRDLPGRCLLVPGNEEGGQWETAGYEELLVGKQWPHLTSTQPQVLFSQIMSILALM